MYGVYVIFILVEHHFSFFFYFYILEELYLMVHTFIIQEFITFKYRKSYLWIINLRYILMSHISKLLDNNSKSEILLSDIKDYAIIPLGFLDYRRNAFINITNLIRSFSNGLG